MAAHATHDPAPEPTAGAALLPIFALALVAAVVAIALVIAYPGILSGGVLPAAYAERRERWRASLGAGAGHR